MIITVPSLPSECRALVLAFCGSATQLLGCAPTAAVPELSWRTVEVSAEQVPPLTAAMLEALKRTEPGSVVCLAFQGGLATVRYEPSPALLEALAAARPVRSERQCLPPSATGPDSALPRPEQSRYRLHVFRHEYFLPDSAVISVDIAKLGRGTNYRCRSIRAGATWDARCAVTSTWIH